MTTTNSFLANLIQSDKAPRSTFPTLVWSPSSHVLQRQKLKLVKTASITTTQCRMLNHKNCLSWSHHSMTTTPEKGSEENFEYRSSDCAILFSTLIEDNMVLNYARNCHILRTLISLLWWLCEDIFSLKQAVRGIHYIDKENEVTINFDYQANVQCPTLSPLTEYLEFQPSNLVNWNPRYSWRTSKCDLRDSGTYLAKFRRLAASAVPE